METRTELKCDQCGTRFEPRSPNRYRIPTRFCSAVCSVKWHNSERLKGAALRKKLRAVQTQPRPSRKPPQTLDDLAAAEGLPPGSYPPGAMGALSRKRSGIEIVPVAERPALLLAAARRLGLTEEGPILKAARAASARASEATV